MEATWVSPVISAASGLLGAIIGAGGSYAAQRYQQSAIGQREAAAREQHEGRVRAVLAGEVAQLVTILGWQVENAGVWDLTDLRHGLDAVEEFAADDLSPRVMPPIRARVAG